MGPSKEEFEAELPPKVREEEEVFLFILKGKKNYHEKKRV